ncbi:MAG: hypothetical protein ACERKZ_20495 [Lachnotalea sp.]
MNDWEKMNLLITDEIMENNKDAIFKGLLEFNLSRIENKNPKDLVYI